MNANAPLREPIVRNPENAIDRLTDDFERVEFWATALTAFLHPIPGYEAVHSDFLWGGQNDRAGGVAGAPGGSV